MRGKWQVEATKLSQRLEKRAPSSWEVMSDEQLTILLEGFAIRPPGEPDYVTALCAAASTVVNELINTRAAFNEMAEKAETQQAEFELLKSTYRRAVGDEDA